MNYKVIDTIDFPSERMININMMPIISHDPKSLPLIIRPYWDIIDKCDRPNIVSYLTIREGYVPAGDTHSRGGIHTEGFDDVRWGGVIGWGTQGGLYMANNVNKSCTIWDMSIDNPGHMGDCSHIQMKDPYHMKANELVWLHDRTPHESVPLKNHSMRQFFRLVTGSISVWYSQHNTPNPLGVPVMTKIVHHNKFK